MEPRCKRKVIRDKYERNAPEIRNWWYELFDILEFDASIAPDKKLSILHDVFPLRILKRITSILSMEEAKYKADPSEKSPSEDKLELATAHKVRFGSDASLDTRRSTFDYDELSENAKDIESLSSPPSVVLKKDTIGQPHDKAAPYMNFFKRRPDRAAIWRALPPLLLEEMNLMQKAAAITEAIAVDFVSWIKTLAGDEESNLTVNSVMEMFEIAMQINSATSLCVKLKEMPSVPQQVATAMSLPDMAAREMLYKEIMRDHRAARRKCKIVAFGRRLPTDMQVKPLKENVKKKWLSCDKVPQKLETMAAVWQGITHLKSTEAFCEYLYVDRKDITPPKYLVDCGMMDPQEIISRRQSTYPREDTDFVNVSHISATLG